MDKRARRKRGIWCMETVWFRSESNQSLRPMLDLMHASYATPVVYRNAVSKDEFFYFLDAWATLGKGKRKANSDEEYPVLVLSYHGAQGTISLKDDTSIELDDADTWDNSVVSLTEIQEELAGRCTDRIIHFSSCSSLDVRHDEIDDFLNVTNASAISGYSKIVPWVQAFALDLLYLDAVQNANRVKLSPSRMSEVNEDFRWGCEDIDGLAEGDGRLPTEAMVRRLGFNMRVRTVPAR